MRKIWRLVNLILAGWFLLNSLGDNLACAMALRTKGERQPVPPPRVETREQIGGGSGNIVYTTTPTFYWDSVLGYNVIEYQFELARDEAFTQLDSMRIIPGEYSYSYTYDVPLVNGVTYYWRMRARNPDGYGPWSVTRSFRVDLSYAPSAPILISPRDGEANVAARTIFEWGSVPRATQYNLQISAGDPNFSTPGCLVGGCTTSSTSCVPSGLIPNSLLYWRVRAYTEDAYSPYSQVWSFHTINDTERPIIRNFSPTGVVRASRIPTRVNLSIEAIDQGSPPSGIDTVRFSTIGWGWEGETAAVELSSPSEGDTYTAEFNVSSEGRHRFAVRARDRAGNSVYDEYTVEVRLSGPEAPILRSPGHGSRVSTSQVTFSWDAVDYASWYSLELRRETISGSLVFNYPHLFATSLTYSLSSGRYVWQLRACNESGCSGPHVGWFEVVVEEPSTMPELEINRYRLKKVIPQPIPKDTTVPEEGMPERRPPIGR